MDNINGILCKKFIYTRDMYNNFTNEVKKNEIFIQSILQLKTNNSKISNIINDKIKAIREKLTRIKSNNQIFNNYMTILSKQSRCIKHKYNIQNTKWKKITFNNTPNKLKKPIIKYIPKRHIISIDEKTENNNEVDLIGFLDCFNTVSFVNFNNIF